MRQNNEKQQQTPWALLFLTGLTLYAGNLVFGSSDLHNTLGDTDDAMRLVQLRDFLHSGSWYNLHTDRVGGPLGYTSHWSRIPDLLLAAIYSTIKPFSSVAFAEWAVRAVYPGLWLIASFVTMGLFTFKVIGNRMVVLVGFLLLSCNGLIYTQFLPGRIDHHNAQIALSVLCVFASAIINENWRWAVLTGVSSGLLLTIGLEGAPFMAVAGAIVGLRYVMFNDGPKITLTYTSSFAVTTLAGLAISLPPSRWTETACDAIAFNLTAAIVSGCAILFAWAASPQLSGAVLWRSVGVVLAGCVAAAVFVVLDPTCLQGPFGHVNPAIKPLWLNKVLEIQPIIRWDNLPATASKLAYVIFGFPALLSIFWLVRFEEYKKSLPFYATVLAFLVSLSFGFLSIRMTSYVVWFATPLHCMTIFKLFENRPRGLKAALLSVAILITSPLPLQLLSMEAASLVANTEETPEPRWKNCAQTADYLTLAKLPAGLVMGEINFGPYILALTPHDVVSAPYHRIGDSILQTVHFFTIDPIETAHQVAQEKGVTYVAICNQKDQPIDKTSVFLKEQIRARMIPAWLEPVNIEPDNPIEIYRVKKLKD